MMGRPRKRFRIGWDGEERREWTGPFSRKDMVLTLVVNRPFPKEGKDRAPIQVVVRKVRPPAHTEAGGCGESGLAGRKDPVGRWQRPAVRAGDSQPSDGS